MNNVVKELKVIRDDLLDSEWVVTDDETELKFIVIPRMVGLFHFTLEFASSWSADKMYSLVQHHSEIWNKLPRRLKRLRMQKLPP